MKPLSPCGQPPRTVVGAWCVAGFLVMMVGGSFTEALFSRVGYPGAGWGGVPVTFDLAGKRAALDQLAAQGTLDLFGWVQVVDITIIVGTLLFFTALSVLAWRAHPIGGRLDRLGERTTAAFVLAPTADAAENNHQADPDRRTVAAADRAQPRQLTRHPGQDRPVHRRLGGTGRAAAGCRVAGGGKVRQVRATAGQAFPYGLT
jgi:hypothetical protein